MFSVYEEFSYVAERAQVRLAFIWTPFPFEQMFLILQKSTSLTNTTLTMFVCLCFRKYLEHFKPQTERQQVSCSNTIDSLKVSLALHMASFLVVQKVSGPFLC